MPNTDDRTPSDAGIFDNMFAQHKRQARPPHKYELVYDIIDRAEKGEYDGKTLLFCWEHKNIPYIVAGLGLTDKQLHWGLDPDSGEDKNMNFSAIWVFTPRDHSLQVYKQFEVVGQLGATNSSGAAAFALDEPKGGYKNLVISMELTPSGGNDDK
ncbi:hypothetical protein WJX81_001788 [Elliptochloris bilobata]|uniref:Uncharacterized protein n=1 Tax=Elliptochloris bilobata TaxID=381761 RepID=A0AAW1QGR9_9CHLO